jgi:alpha-tubulin suppressor-like RCC1 family protein
MALSETGELLGWGAAACGQLGFEDLQHLPKDSENSPYEPDPQPVKLLRGKVITAVSCGEAHTLTLTDKGCVYSFGASNCGQLGLKSEFLHARTQRRSQNESKLVSYQEIPKLVTGLLDK